MFKRERLKKIIADLEKRRISDLKTIDNIIYKKGDFKRPVDADASEVPFAEFKKDSYWGGENERYWFRSEIIIPDDFIDEIVVIQLETGKEGQWDAINPQFLLFVNDEIEQGIDVNHTEIILTKKGIYGERFKLDFHAFAGMQAQPVKFKLKLGILNEMTEKLIYDLRVPYEVTDNLSEDDNNYIQILNHLTKAINMLDLKRNNPTKEYYISLMNARNYLKNNFYNNKELVKILKSKDLLPTVTCVGHSHIDIAWLWTLKQTREKVVRSFSTVLKLMDEYPEYKFMASQPILLDFIKEDYPELFVKIKERISEGRFEVEGAMWLEADCNLSSGESLIRHILYGQNYMRDEFNKESEILWLPDVFGYTASLPQILKQFDIHTFVTTKISWNEYNKMPLDTFKWSGIDKSEVLTYFITMMDYENYKKGSFKTVYEGEINPSQIQGAWARYQQKDLNQNILISYGHGDGGGGPTKKMLENARRMNDYIPGLPHVELSSLTDYFKGLKTRLNGPLRTWEGELYLEYHRGTLTTMGKNKWYNRKSEFLYQNIEHLSVLCKTLLGMDYNNKLIKDGWYTILLNQFHDIIPGTSIEEVYIESHAQYEEILKNGLEFKNELVLELANYVYKKSNISSSCLVVFNPLSIESNQIIRFEHIEEVNLTDEKENEYEVQKKGGENTFICENIPSKGYKIFFIKPKNKISQEIVQTRKFSTEFYNIVFDKSGFIVSLFDKEANREVAKKDEKLNSLIVYEDRPHNWDAWDINIYYEEKPYLINELSSFKIIEKGSVYTKIEVIREFQDSKITQWITIYNKFRRIDFDTEVDWNEKHLLLKAAFPVEIQSSTATYDLQFGNIERSTHRNTSWDEAKFEVCGHKWADLSERGYGVSLLNDSKYGYDIFNQVIRLSLLRSSNYPNPNADIGLHRFKYALLPHMGTWHETTYKEGYNFNVDMITKVIEGQKEHENINGVYSNSYFGIDKENIIIETIKESEDKKGIIIRMYETTNTATEANLSINIPYSSIHEVNLKEQIIDSTNIKGNKVGIRMRPYEIKSYLVM